jgi:hypothetical protein
MGNLNPLQREACGSMSLGAAGSKSLAGFLLQRGKSLSPCNASTGGGVDDAFAQRHEPGIGAEIMGAGKFGYSGWHEDPDWKGWWGPIPPFHTPVIVLTHHTRPPIDMEDGTTFHFLDTSPAEALKAAREAANGQDVRIGGVPCA